MNESSFTTLRNKQIGLGNPMVQYRINTAYPVIPVSEPNVSSALYIRHFPVSKNLKSLLS